MNKGLITAVGAVSVAAAIGGMKIIATGALLAIGFRVGTHIMLTTEQWWEQRKIRKEKEAQWVS